MIFVIAGSSGFLGTAWRDHLAQQGHEVIRLVRGDAVSQHESHWDPYRGIVDQQVIENADVVANIAGAPLVGFPYSRSFHKKLRDSRVRSTQTLADAIAKADRKPAFLAQNGSSFYGDRGDEILTEESSAGSPGSSVLTDITKEWQAATDPARESGARVCVMRSGVIVHKSGGAFRPLSLLFRAGLGGPIGSGQQYFPLISRTDWVRAATFLGTNEASEGVYNLSGPDPTTNEEFAKELGRMLHRPALVRVPAFVVRRALGGFTGEVLGSVRVQPAKLLADGFDFEHPTLNTRLASALTD